LRRISKDEVHLFSPDSALVENRLSSPTPGKKGLAHYPSKEGWQHLEKLVW
jgi:hypothetical protein